MSKLGWLFCKAGIFRFFLHEILFIIFVHSEISENRVKGGLPVYANAGGKKTKLLHIEFIVTSHNSVAYFTCHSFN